MTDRMNRVVHLALVALSVAIIVSGYHAKSSGIMLAGLALVLLFDVYRLEKQTTSLALAMICLGLAVSEWLVPLAFPPRSGDNVLQYDQKYWGPLSEVGMQANAGVYPSSSRSETGEVVYDVHYTIGSDRLRVTPNNPSGPHRVNFFGCSFTFGEGLQDNETLPYFYARATGNVSVRNFGFHGYGAHHAVALLESWQDTTGDVNLYFTAPFHIERSVCNPDWTYGSPRFELQGDGSVKRSGSCGDGRDKMRVRRKWLSNYSNTIAKIDGLLSSRINDGSVELYIALVKRMAEISHMRGQRLVVGFLRGGEGAYTNTSYSDEKVLAEFSRFADDVVDLDLPEPPPNDKNRYRVHALDGHPGAQANRERAEILARELKQYLR